MGESTRIISQDGIEDTLLPVPHFLLPQIVGVERLSASEAVISSILDERIELESLEDFEDFRCCESSTQLGVFSSVIS